MNRQKVFNILVILTIIFIVFAATVPFIDTAGMRWVSTSRFVTLFRFTEDYILRIWNR